jgi:hypothetical protein
MLTRNKKIRKTFFVLVFLDFVKIQTFYNLYEFGDYTISQHGSRAFHHGKG